MLRSEYGTLVYLLIQFWIQSAHFEYVFSLKHFYLRRKSYRIIIDYLHLFKVAFFSKEVHKNRLVLEEGQFVTAQSDQKMINAPRIIFFYHTFSTPSQNSSPQTLKKNISSCPVFIFSFFAIQQINKMQYLLIITLVLQVIYSAPSDNPNFAQWKVTVGKKYGGNSEETYRAAVYNKNLQQVRQNNKNPKRTYEKGTNQFSDLTSQEFAAVYLTLKVPPSAKSVMLDQDSPSVAGLTQLSVGAYVITAIDWRSKLNATNVKLVPKVRNQGGCGSCWAFAAASAMEYNVASLFKMVATFSTQQLVSCSNSSAGYGNYGCNGGWMSQAYRYGKTSNISDLSQYPYYSGNGTVFGCDMVKRNRGKYIVNTYVTVNSNYKTDALCSPMLDRVKIGPVAVALNANPLQNYKSGILPSSACSGDDINHGVTLIGNDKNGNWNLLNSWGTTWGEKGYFRMANGNTCNICLYGAMAVVMKKVK